jgi:phytoene dehydrogenase-like protein
MKRVAVIGSGIAGLATAHALAGEAQVTLFEAGDYFGGHTHTVDVTLDGVTHGVDTGFLVFNHRTYPNLIACSSELGVATAPSDMSFSVQVPNSGPGVERLQPGHRLRAAAQPAAPALPGHAGRDPALQPLATALAERGGRSRTGRAHRRLPGPRPLRRDLPRLVLPADDRLHLVLPDRPDAALSDRHADPLLPQPRADPGQPTGRSGTPCAAARSTT